MSRLDGILNRLDETLDYAGFGRIEEYIAEGTAKALRAIPAPGYLSYWTDSLARALREPLAWEEDDRRLVHVLLHLKADNDLWDWLDGLLAREKPEHDLFGVVARECKGRTPPKVAASALRRLSHFTRGGQPTSFGRYLLALSKKDLTQAIKATTFTHTTPDFVAFLLDHDPKRVDAVLPAVLDCSHWHGEVFEVLLCKRGDQYEKFVAKQIDQQKDVWGRFRSMTVLHAFAPQRYHAAALAIAREALAASTKNVDRERVAEWMAANGGTEVVPDLKACAGKAVRAFDVSGMAQSAVDRLGVAAVPIFEVLLENENAEVRAVGIESLIALQDSKQDAAIEAALREGLCEKIPQDVLRILTLVQKWKPKRVLDALWKTLGYDSRPVRVATARVLASCDDEVVEEATALLTHKRGDIRLAAADILTIVGSDQAFAALEDRLDQEKNEDVRDQMLVGLETAWAKQGRETTKADITKRIKRMGDKLDQPVADWLAEDGLPPLKWNNGKRFSPREVRYLLYRQSRAKEIKADPEAAAVYRLIDRTRSAPFAAALMSAFLQSEQAAADRWAMTVACMLGDDQLVSELVSQIHDWAESSRGKMAEWAAQALALLGTDAALLAVDALAIRYRSKMKNIGRAAAEAFAEAAERMGITPDELGDRVVPWLCFEPNEPCVIEGKKSNYEVRIGPDFKLRYLDLDKNKIVKSVPSSVSADTKYEMKNVAALLREVIKAQKLRLENLFVGQRRWSAARWRELFIEHPVLFPFAVRMIWGAYDKAGKLTGLFRALEDRTLTTSADEAYKLPAKANVGMVHPLEMDDDVRAAWATHMADYEIEPPFPQLDRDVITVAPKEREEKQYRALNGKTLNGMTFKGRAERLGWVRGSVADAGSILAYHKVFATAGVDVHIELEDMFIGMDMYQDITLGTVCFVRDGNIKYGSYEYDTPGGEDDPRALRFADVPPIVFSEAMGDLKRIAGGRSDED